MLETDCVVCNDVRLDLNSEVRYFVSGRIETQNVACLNENVQR